MSAANLLTEPDAITVEQFLEMDLPDACEWLLLNGTVVSVTHARFPHSRVQSNIHALLLRLVEGTQSLVFTELPYELDRINGHRADVALLLNSDRGQTAIDTDRILTGPPDLVVEVMSRSNVPYDIDELEQECFKQGGLMFWKVVIRHRQRLDFGTPDFSVRVGHKTGRDTYRHKIYQINDVIPVELPAVTGKISVRDVFAGVMPSTPDK